MPHPLLTIVIPSFNRPEKTARAVASVVAQAADCEIIVVDDASTPPLALSDNTPESGTIRLIRRDVNGGPAAARNSGVQNATGTIIGFLDSDDVFLPDTLRARLAFARDGGIEAPDGMHRVFGCGWHEVDAGGGMLRTRHPQPTISPDDFFGGCWFCPGSAVLMNRALFSDGPGPFDERLRRLEDLDWFARLAGRGGTLVTQPVVGAAVERGSPRAANHILDAIAHIDGKFAALAESGKVDGHALGRLRAYLAFERAHLMRSQGRGLAMAMALTESYLRAPRLRLYPGRGWT